MPYGCKERRRVPRCEAPCGREAAGGGRQMNQLEGPLCATQVMWQLHHFWQ